MPSPSATLAFYDSDFERTIFPLRTNQWLISVGEQAIREYLDGVFDPQGGEKTFLPQQRCYGIKHAFHLRRTVKLDFLSEFYFYDVIFRNRERFRPSMISNRLSFGYRFSQGQAESPSLSYAAFKAEIAKAAKRYKRMVSFDVASYFNSVYHHDLVSWAARLGFDTEDTQRFGRFLRETSAGRSVDCLPQGIYPAKMVGASFLNFVDTSALSCDVALRFMDDFYLFSDSEEVLQKDFIYVQALLGERGLSVNPKKTRFSAAPSAVLDGKIDDMKKQLLEKRRRIIALYDDAESPTTEISVVQPLSPVELAYVRAMLNNDSIEEEDAELILTVLSEHTDLVEARLPSFFHSFPNLAKTIARFCRNISPGSSVEVIINSILKSGQVYTEYQLFWIVSLIQERISTETKLGNFLQTIFESTDSPIVKAKILETRTQGFGLAELREAFVRSGQSDWLSWSSAVAMRELPAISRNHVLNYFANSSQINRLVAKIVKSV